MSINRTIKTILNDRNYKKYAIKKPKNLKQIKKLTFGQKIEQWNLSNLMHKLLIFTISLVLMVFTYVNAEVIKDLKISGNKRVSNETIKIYGKIEIGKDYSESDLDQF